MVEHSEEPEELFTAQEHREHKVFLSLLKTVPRLEERLMTASSKQDVQFIAALLQKGASNAHSDDMKSLKAAIIDWLLLLGQPLIPPLAWNRKADCGFNHKLTGALLCPAGIDWSNQEIKQKLHSGELTVLGNQWPIFLYKSYEYDNNDPWKGLLRSQLLIKAFRHIFTLPSSVNKDAKATRSGSTCIHGMTYMMRASIAYAATQARFALLSVAVFTQTNTVTDSEQFYNSILKLLEDQDEIKEVDCLLTWWNRQVFPNSITSSRPVSKDSTLAKIKAKRAALKQAALMDIDLNS